MHSLPSLLRLPALSATAAVVLVCALLSAPTTAKPLAYTAANTATLVREGDAVMALATPFATRLVKLEVDDATDEMTIDIGGTVIRLWREPSGLSKIEWPETADGVLSRDDITALAGAASTRDVPTWSALIDWPSVGKAVLVVYRVRDDGYGGLLSSRPSGVQVLRQMAFQPHTVRARPAPDRLR